MKITPTKKTIDAKKYPKIVADLEVNKTLFTGCEHEGLSPFDEKFFANLNGFIDAITVAADLGDGWAEALTEGECRVSAVTFKPAGLMFQLCRLIKFEDDDSQSLKTSAMVTYYSMTQKEAEAAGELMTMTQKYLSETPVQGDLLGDLSIEVSANLIEKASESVEVA